ncbi:DUF202 domain-containing protein [Micromonospora sonneratiae]|uniref:DUF202 domain-containing protein n=1 Tax=Micromonospora sonneratiae TaxID=1184706 RepID=A0ABW3YCV8_9ACTN
MSPPPVPSTGGSEPEPPAEGGKPGLVAERTRLAWQRTNLATLVVTLLVARLALSKGIAAAPLTAKLIAVGALAAWLTMALVTLPRVTGRARRHTDGGGPALPTAALVTVGYAVLGLALILFTDGLR